MNQALGVFEVFIIGFIPLVLVVIGLLPRNWKTLKPYEGSLITRFGRVIQKRGPGGIVHVWPMIDTIAIANMQFLSVRIPLTKLATGKTTINVGVHIQLVLHIMDVELYALRFRGDPRDTIVNLVRGAVTRELQAMDGIEVFNNKVPVITEAVRIAVSNQIGAWGMTLDDVTITDIDPSEDQLKNTQTELEARARAKAMTLLSDVEIKTTTDQRNAQGNLYMPLEILDRFTEAARTGFGHFIGGDFAAEIIALVKAVQEEEK